ncbi:MAG: tetratricopeptide repeat protein [Gemmataceae bacterium]
MRTSPETITPVSWGRVIELYYACEYQQALAFIDQSNLCGALSECGDQPDLAGVALAVANVYRDVARFADAESYYLQALAGLSAEGQERPAFAAGMVELADLYDQLGRTDQAVSLLNRARAIYEQTSPRCPGGHSRCLQELAYAHEQQGRRSAAVAAIQQARKMLEFPSAGPLDLARLLLAEVWCLVHVEGGALGAIDRAREALRLFTIVGPAGRAGVARTSLTLGRALVGMHQLDEAAGLLEAAARWYRAELGEDGPRMAATLEAQALLHLAQGNVGEAEALARRGLKLTVASMGERHVWTAQSHQELGSVLQTAHRLTAAAESFEKAAEIVRECLGDAHPTLAEAQLNLAEVHDASGRRGVATDLMQAAVALLDAHPDDVRYERSGALLARARLAADAGEYDEAMAAVQGAIAFGEAAGDGPFLVAPALLLQSPLEAARGETTAAVRLLDRAKKLLAVLPPHHPTQLDITRAEAVLAQMQGDPNHALRLARQAVERVEQSGGERSPWLSSSLRFLAEQLLQSGDLAGSESAYERAFEVQRRRGSPEDPDLASTLLGLARLHLARGNAQAADVRLRQAWEIRKNAYGEDHPLTAEVVAELASLVQQAGDLPAAEYLWRKALEVRRSACGDLHPDTLAAVHGLATVVWARGDSAGAAELLEHALASLGEGHIEQHGLRHTLALIVGSRGETTRSLEMLNQILQANEKALGDTHDGLVPVLNALARTHATLGDHLQARALLERARSIHRRSPFPHPLKEAPCLLGLSESHRQLYDLDRASALAAEALQLSRGFLRNDPGLLEYLMHAALVHRSQKQFGAAASLLAEADRLVRHLGGKRHPYLVAVWLDQGRLEAARGQPHQATHLFERAAELARQVLGEDHPDHAAARQTLGLHLLTSGDPARAEPHLRTNLDIVRRSCGGDHPAVAVALQPVVELHRQRGDLAAAEAEARRGLNLVRLSEHPADGLHAQYLHCLATVVRQQKGRLGEAADLLRQALVIDRDLPSGEEGSGHLDSQQELAVIEAALGDHAHALERLHRVLAAQVPLISAFGCLPEGKVRDGLLEKPWSLVEQVLTLAPQVPGSAEAALAAVLLWKSLLPGALAVGDRTSLQKQVKPGQRAAVGEWCDLSLQIAYRLISSAGLEGLQTHRALLARWGARREELEADLANHAPTLARLRAWRASGLADLRRVLPRGGALVELVRYRPRDFAEICANREGLLPPRYLAFVVSAGQEGVVMLDAGQAKEVEGGGSALRAALAPHLESKRSVVVADGGRLSARICRALAGDAEVRRVSSGREVVSPLLALPESGGWLERLRQWLGL